MNQPGGGAAVAAGGRLRRSPAAAQDAGREHRRGADASGTGDGAEFDPEDLRPAVPVSATACANGACAASTCRSTGCCRRPSTIAATAAGRARGNIDKFLAQARDAAGRMSLDEFVEELALVRASNPREPDAPPEDSANAVQGDDRAFGQGAGVSDGVRGGPAQRRGDQSAGGGLFAAHRAGRALAQSRGRAAKTRTISSSTPSARNAAGARPRRATGCSTSP